MRSPFQTLSALALAILAFAGLYTVQPTAAVSSSAQSSSPTIQVFRSATCGCCKKWVAHLRENGFSVSDSEIPDVNAIKVKNKLPLELGSCHTALVGDYVVEGHVPAEDIRKLIETKPSIRGIAVPRMPAGTPGMDMGGRKDPYDVIAYDAQGKTSVFSHH